jgi:hypothetical protein
MQSLADDHRGRPSVLSISEVFSQELKCTPKMQKLFARNVENLCYGLSQIPPYTPFRYLVGVVQINEEGKGMCALFSRQQLLAVRHDDAQLIHAAEAGMATSAGHMAVVLVGPAGKEVQVVDVPKVLQAYSAKAQAMSITTSPGSTESN